MGKFKISVKLVFFFFKQVEDFTSLTVFIDGRTWMGVKRALERYHKGVFWIIVILKDSPIHYSCFNISVKFYSGGMFYAIPLIGW